MRNEPAILSAYITMSAHEPQDAVVGEEVCYRHPDRETGIRCQRCDRHICVDCRHQASVGVHCPECTKNAGTQKIYNARNLPGSNFTITKVLVGLNVLAYFATVGLTTVDVAGTFATWGPAIWENNEIWRIVSGGFLHANILHIGFNMYLLWQLGRQIEKVTGEVKFIAIYFVSLLGGTFGAILLDPAIPVVGASGAVFGLIGFMVFLLRSRGVGLFDTGLGFLIVINVLFSFRGGISLGGHLGGLLTGFLLGILFYGANFGNKPVIKGDKAQLAVCGVLGAVLFAAAYFISSTWMNPLF